MTCGAQPNQRVKLPAPVLGGTHLWTLQRGAVAYAHFVRRLPKTREIT
jgi:hypothetical protein